jgi:hypothetical protein
MRGGKLRKCGVGEERAAHGYWMKPVRKLDAQKRTDFGRGEARGARRSATVERSVVWGDRWSVWFDDGGAEFVELLHFARGKRTWAAK